MATFLAKGSSTAAQVLCKPISTIRDQSYSRTTTLPFNPLSFEVSLPKRHIQSHHLGGSCRNLTLRRRFRGRNKRFIMDNGCSERNSVVCSSAGPEQPPLPSEPKSNGWWKSWTLGALLSVGLPFSGNKMGPLATIRDELATRLQTTEDAVEAIERGASRIEKIAEKSMMEENPGSTFVPKKALIHIERLAQGIAKRARSVDDVIDKIQEVALLESAKNEEQASHHKEEVEDKVVEKRTIESNSR